MRSTTFVRTGVIVLAVAIVGAPARAQQEAGRQTHVSNGQAIEVTPFIGLGPVGASRIGAAISFPVAPKTSVEAEVGYRRGEGKIHALGSNVSMLYALPRIRRATPYLATGVGLHEFGAPVVLPGDKGVVTQPRIAFTVNAGGGIKVPVDDQVSMRTDVRWFKSFGAQGSEHWRVAHGVSFPGRKR